MFTRMHCYKNVVIFTVVMIVNFC